MARVPGNEVVDAIEGNLAAPGTRERRRIVDGELVENRVGAHAGEAFDHLQALGRAAKSLERMKVRRLDDERIAFPPSDRIAHPGAEVWRETFTPDPDDPDIVHHLDEDHDVIPRLHDLIVVVVEVVGQHGRSGVRAERHDAALAEWTELRVVVLAPAAQFGGARRVPLTRLLRQRRNLAVSRIHDERASPLAVDDRDAVAGIQPEIVVAADIACRSGRSVATFRRRRPVRIAGSSRRLARSSTPFSSRSTSSFVSVTRDPSGRSSGVIVPLVHVPWRSG